MTKQIDNHPAAKFSLPAMRPTIILLLGLALLLGTSCGKKNWPKPPGDMDSFRWNQITTKTSESCLILKTSLSGNRNNIMGVTLQLQIIAPDDDCKNCPFSQTESHDMEIDRVALEHSPKDSLLTMTFCLERPFSPDLLYRYRLIGHNAAGVAPALSLPAYLTIPETYDKTSSEAAADRKTSPPHQMDGDDSTGEKAN